MNFFGPLSKKIRAGEPVPWYLDALLGAMTPAYRVGMLLRAMQSPIKVEARVISVGNLTVGGTGKTPAVIERAESEIAAGNKVAVLTRGYGATEWLDKLVCVNGTEAIGIPTIVGDEPALIARRVPEVLIVRGADRVAAARLASEVHGSNVLILDDGFQYIRLARDENILVIDATDPFGNGRLLPRGALREPLQSIRRATHVILTHCDRVGGNILRGITDTVRSFSSRAHIRMTWHEPFAVWSQESGERHAIEVLKGKRVIAVCAIARPHSFVKTLESLGATVAELRAFPDHARIPDGAFAGEGMTVTTEKDAARLVAPVKHLYVLAIRLADFEGVSDRP